MDNKELHQKIREVFKQDPNYNDILNLTGDMGLYDIESLIIKIFQDSNNE